MVLGSHTDVYVCVCEGACVCIHLPSPRRKTRIKGGEREEALSLSVRLFLTAAISLIRLWRNINLALHRPNLPLTLSSCISLARSPPILLLPHALSLLHSTQPLPLLSICLSVPLAWCVSSTFSEDTNGDEKE